MEVWSELTETNVGGVIGVNNSEPGYKYSTQFQRMTGMGGTGNGGSVTNSSFHFFVPLRFWFCRNPGLALPLIALQYHEVNVILNHHFDNAFGTDKVTKNDLWVDYIYLDTDERRRFAQTSHEYLIEQIQQRPLSNPTGASKLDFNHPVKELIWTYANSDKGFDFSLTAGGNYGALYPVIGAGSSRGGKWEILIKIKWT
jgi:hypothetical protein